MNFVSPSASFRTRLAVLLLLGVVPALALVVYMNIEQRRLETGRVREGAIAAAELSAANEQNYVSHTRQLLATVSQFSFLMLTPDRELGHEHFSNLRKLAPDYLNFGLIETNGTLFCSSELFTNALDLADRAYFKRVIESKQFAAGNFQIGKLTGLPGLNFGYPVLDDEGKLRRVLFASVRLALLSDALARSPLPAESSISLLDRNGTVLARFPEPENWVGQSGADPALLARIFELRKGVFEMEGPDRVPRLHAVTAISDSQAPSLFVTVAIPLRVCYERANHNLVRNLIFLGLAALIIPAVGSYYAKWSVLRPVNALAKSADQLAAGNLNARVGPIRGPVELMQLGRAFDEMADSLQARQKEIENANVQIRRMNEELDLRVKDRTAALEMANKELEAFSYSVSHDLRAPLRHISGFVDLLQRKNSSLDEDGRRFVGFIGTAGKQMSTLVEDLLNFSRMSRTQMNLAPVNLSELVTEVRASFTGDLNGRTVEWLVQELPEVPGDAPLLRVVLSNLIGNSVKYTRPRTQARIEIGVQPDERQHVIFVRDNGVGFDMKFADKLFGVFQRFHHADEFEGTGIGLATVQRIILRLGGQVWAEAVEGQGATFFFSLPRIQKNS